MTTGRKWEFNGGEFQQDVILAEPGMFFFCVCVFIQQKQKHIHPPLTLISEEFKAKCEAQKSTSRDQCLSDTQDKEEVWVHCPHKGRHRYS